MHLLNEREARTVIKEFREGKYLKMHMTFLSVFISPEVPTDKFNDKLVDDLTIVSFPIVRQLTELYWDRPVTDIDCRDFFLSKVEARIHEIRLNKDFLLTSTLKAFTEMNNLITDTIKKQHIQVVFIFDNDNKKKLKDYTEHLPFRHYISYQ